MTTLNRTLIPRKALLFSLIVAVMLPATPAAALPPGNLDTHYASFQPSDRQQSTVVSLTYNHCMDRAQGVTVALLDCIGVEFDRVDGLLNQRYRQLMTSLAAPQRERLRRSERRWLATREGPCDADNEGGTLGQIGRNMCMLSELRRRVLWLRSLS